MKYKLKQEIELIKASYPGNETVAENLKRNEVIGTISTTIQNKKVMKLLKDTILK